jgi:hypothetical protein
MISKCELIAIPHFELKTGMVPVTTGCLYRLGVGNYRILNRQQFVYRRSFSIKKQTGWEFVSVIDDACIRGDYKPLPDFLLGTGDRWFLEFLPSHFIQ